MATGAPSGREVVMRRVLAPALVSLAALSACTGGTVSTMTYPSPFTLTSARGALQDAGSFGPVLLQVRGNPFPEDVAQPIAETASRTSVGFLTRFTTDPVMAARPDYRVVVQFDPDPRLPAAVVCDPRLPTFQTPTPGELTALVVFCRETMPMLALTARAPRPEHADSPVVRDIAQQAMLRMFGGEPRGADSPSGRDSGGSRRLRS
jgi:hypothetical protein